MNNFIYPAIFTKDNEEGGFIITFVDFPEAITQAETKEQSMLEAEDCLEEVIANRIVMNLPIPKPSLITKKILDISLSAQMSAKAALYLAIKEKKITNVELAKALKCDEKEIRRLLDPKHPSKLPRIESALAVLGSRLIVGFKKAA